jgi:hypothetical protein
LIRVVFVSESDTKPSQLACLSNLAHHPPQLTNAGRKPDTPSVRAFCGRVGKNASTRERPIGLAVGKDFPRERSRQNAS